MTGCSRILTEKGAAFKESKDSKKSCKRKSQKGTQVQSAALSHKKKAAETDNSTSSEDDDRPQKWRRQPDPEEIEINDDSDKAEDVEVIDGSDEVDEEGEQVDKEGEQVDEGDEEHGNGHDSDIEMLDSTVSHVDFYL